ncbi:uncharacterized protein C8Q71DRAFT_532149 [Rhodofomes roseus]|uniref:Uncharacterized protein n=1 Tax=Rhodofomes roseus TaxID=34475 RepID=A0ABQ8KKP6_9APHY|nr:uncharacterized protein C8Q71DRAFT_532149 [Rhodofomes roseus]KAH9838473.1 hypothetical protein C8Q71DRAFT_532149 [Rhodofomes roseus]
MVAELNILSVNLATACMESFLYGIFCILSGTSTYLLLRRGREQMAAGMSSRPMWRTPMFIAGCLIALTVTGHWILTVVRLFDAFVNYKGGAEPIIAFADLSMMTEVIKTAFLVVTVLISDAMIIYRLYIVWSYNKFIIIFPVMTWCGLIACGTGVCWQFAVYTLGDDVFKTSAGRWITSDCVFTFTTNIYCSLLIAYRVWRTRITTQAYGGANIMGALAIIIESAALQSSWNLIFFVTYQAKSNIQFTTCDLWAPICGISLTLINLRVALGWAQKAHTSASSGVPRVTAVSQARSYASAADQNFAMRPLAVNITRVVNQEDDFGGMKKADYSSQGSILPV